MDTELRVCAVNENENTLQCLLLLYPVQQILQLVANMPLAKKKKKQPFTQHID